MMKIMRYAVVISVSCSSALCPLCAMEPKKEQSFDFDNAIKRQESLKKHEEEALASVLQNNSTGQVQESPMVHQPVLCKRVNTLVMEDMVKNMQHIQNSGVSLVQPSENKTETSSDDELFGIDDFDEQLRHAKKSVLLAKKGTKHLKQMFNSESDHQD